MRLKCEQLERTIVSNRNLILAGACLTALLLPVSSALAGGLNSHDSKRLLSDNTAYDGATLPAPAKKKNQVTLSGDDTPDDTNQPRRRRAKRGESDAPTPTSDAMNSAESTSAGASLPQPKKGPRPGDGPARPNVANEKEGRGPDRRGGGGGHDPGNFFGKGPLDLTALSLTDEQKQKIAQMRTDNGMKMRDLMRKRKDLSIQMRDLMFDPDVTEAQIRAKRDEVRGVQEKLEDLRLNDFLSIRSALTPEQRQKLKDVKIANKPHADGPPPNSAAPKRADGDAKPDQKRLADTPTK